MKSILIITQTMDNQDDVLGFFHNWVVALAEEYEKITVICLQKGNVAVPSSVKVLSLGKEADVSRLTYISRFYKYIREYKDQYDGVFVHMNMEYVLLGNIFWSLWKKPVYLWYNHRQASLLARYAFLLPKKIFHTSPFAYTARLKNAVQMPVGIDEILFKNKNNGRMNNSILSLGRIAPVKHIDVLVKAALKMAEKDLDCTVHIYGDALDRDKKYFDDVKELAKHLDGKKIFFHGSVPNTEAPKIFSEHEIFVNLTDTGSFDKTIIESMMAGTLTVTSNKSLAEHVGKEFLFEEESVGDLAKTLENIMNMSAEEKGTENKKQSAYASTHTLSSLVQKLVKEMA
jgi:glycosyltransferase involved in cell wall biosynthesis